MVKPFMNNYLFDRYSLFEVIVNCAIPVAQHGCPQGGKG